MGIATDIEWADSTVNPTTGCDGCELWHVINKGPCYAGQLHEGRLAKSLPNLYAANFTEVRLAPGRMAKAVAWSDLTGTNRPGRPWHDGMPRIIFVGDMGDIFSRDVPFAYLHEEIIQAAASPKGQRHILMLLTKQATRAAAFDHWMAERGLAWPENVWQGVSITSEKTVRRAGLIMDHRAQTKFLSVEPLLGPVEIDPAVLRAFRLCIVGGESGPGARPCKIAWIRSIVRQCRAASVPCFVKQLGSKPQHVTMYGMSERPDVPDIVEYGPLLLRDAKGGNPEEWPEDLRVREWPTLTWGGER